VAILQGNAKQGSTRGFYPKTINGSLRFNDDDSAYLSWTPASAGNRKTWTWSGWVKRGNVGNGFALFGMNGFSDKIWFIDNGGDAKIAVYIGAGAPYSVFTDASFRDPSAWYHIVVQLDTTQATDTNRVKVYVNGVQQSYYAATYPTLNYDANINTANQHNLGARESVSSPFDGYLADVYFIDGQALSASDFGETKNGVWVAKDYAGTFGTNGFHLTFEDDAEVEAFNTVLYRGTDVKHSVTGVGFQPDLVWVKRRNSSATHQLHDSVRGAGQRLRSDTTTAEDTRASSISSFDSDGFTIAADEGGVNGSGDSHVAWCWKAGDSNVSNTDGSITSTVRANDTYGFSIVSWTATGTPSDTIGHGLSSVPDMIIVKDRDAVSDWCVYTQTTGAGAFLKLNDTAASTANTTMWNNTSPTSSVFNWGYSGGNDIIAYCWAEKTGYSKFGSYTGTGASGNEITLGFKPAVVIIKRTDSTSDWAIVDNTRDVDPNGDGAMLKLNASYAEANNTTWTQVDLLSNSFRVDSTDSDHNASGGTYIYAAFADTREAAFWLDQSGNDNDWQPVNLDHNDTVADSPTDNFATWNPLRPSNDFTFSDGNLRLVENTTGYATALSTIGVSSGKYYVEIDVKNASGNGVRVGIARGDFAANQGIGTGDSYAISNNLGAKYNQGSSSSYATSFTGDSVIGIALDLDAGTITFTIDGTSYGTAFSGLTGEWFFAVSAFADQSDSITANFGQQPFKYDPPA